MEEWDLFLAPICPSAKPVSGLAARNEVINNSWRNGPKISAGDLKFGRGNVEKIKGLCDDSSSSSNKAVTMGFGKYSQRPMSWVKDNDESYWEWAMENLDFFPGKAAKAGLV
jgi:hypothetical protein